MAEDTVKIPVDSLSNNQSPCSQKRTESEDLDNEMKKSNVNGHTFVPEETDITIQSRDPRTVLNNYVSALRPWSFTASITPVALGSALAYKSTQSFDPFIFLTTVFTALSVHAAGNLVNTYYDYMRGIDTKKSDDRTLVDKRLSPQDVAWFGGFFYICGCAGFLLLTVMSAAKMEHLALVYFCGLSSSFLYTGGLGLKYIALGDLLILLTFGPLTVVFAFLTQACYLTLFPIWYAIPIALNTGAILHSNNARDMDSDKQAGIVTVAILLGYSGSYALFCVLLFVPFMIFILLGLHLTPYMFFPAASVLFAFGLEKQFRRKELQHLPHGVARLNLIMGSLYIFACLMANSASLPIGQPGS